MNASFAADMTRALQQELPIATEEADEDWEDDLLDDALATDGIDQVLAEIPQSMQDGGGYGYGAALAEEKEIEEEMMPELVQDFTTLTALTREIHAADAEKMQFVELYENARPHDQLHKRKEVIQQMTGEEKKYNTKLFNASVVMFKAAKEDSGFRKWFAKFAKQTDDYYSLKTTRKKLLIKIKLLNKIRDEKEMENFKEKQRKRREAEEEEANNGKRSRQRLN